ncbi:MAG TPA: hypothetical protein VFW24_11475 [Acidimicrobiales bacterium]|nr:hypothetical protein [Acidimicrobiales bacterium]
MLRLTELAADHLADAARARGLPDTIGVRVYGEPHPGGGLEVGVRFAVLPAEGDEVCRQGTTRLFIGPEVAEALSEASLDVRRTAEGPTLVLVTDEPDEPG